MPAVPRVRGDLLWRACRRVATIGWRCLPTVDLAIITVSRCVIAGGLYGAGVNAAGVSPLAADVLMLTAKLALALALYGLMGHVEGQFQRRVVLAARATAGLWKRSS